MSNQDHFSTVAQAAAVNRNRARNHRMVAKPDDLSDAVLDELLAEAQLDEAQRRAIRTAQGLTPDDFTR